MKNDFDVMIVGGGPVGLFLAAELVMRGVSTVVFDNKVGTSTHPAANANSARTMEHYRRLGLAAKIRDLGLPGNHPTDVAYFTRLHGHELARLRQPSSAFASNHPQMLEQFWPTPELPHRCSQLYIEPVLLAAATKGSKSRVRYQTTVTRIEQDDTGVTAEVVMPEGPSRRYRARYLVGCDGPRSTVRTLLGLRYSGTAGTKRGFMGGTMAAAYFRAPKLYDRLNGERAWQYWTLNPEQRSLIISVDGRSEFIINIQCEDGYAPDDQDMARRLHTAIGATVPFTLISNSVWTAGFALVAEKMQVGRIFLAGDAAHLFTPTGGLGYNTGIEDAANLAWKLEAVIKGRGEASLLESYEIERRPAASRNTSFARLFADSIGHIRVPEEIEEDSPSGQAARSQLGDYLNFHAYKEFSIPGVQLGTRYEHSPIIAAHNDPAPPDDPNIYVPCGIPGHRAPHVWLAGGRSLFDQFGHDFTLLRLGSHASGITEKNTSLPSWIKDVAVSSQQARSLYGADYILIRPDQHIAWRGNQLDSDFQKTLERSIGIGTALSTTTA